tara:strand:+ start:413 stop:760 length:348 start_codon:yes stop_codon:yes gene_type:complete
MTENERRKQEFENMAHRVSTELCRKCVDRVEDELKDRLEQLRAGELEPLSIDNEIDWQDGSPSYKRVQLSWGGPSDEFRLFKDGTIQYWFMDWYDGAHITMTGNDRRVVSDTWPI